VLVNDEVVFTSSALEAFVAGPTAGKSGRAVARESEAAPLDSVETSEPPAAQRPGPKQGEQPATEPEELSAPADTGVQPVEATSDTGTLSGQAPSVPASSEPAATSSGPAIEEEK
jgi:large subunit ribosomal protein L4